LRSSCAQFRDEAPDVRGQAAKIILDGVKPESGGFLVGDDAHKLDGECGRRWERECEAEFYQSFAAEVGWRIG